jgi:hypothetical protein
MAPFNKTTVENIEDLIRYHNAKQEKALKECHMARFMENLSRPKIEGIYWTMTVLIILLAMAAGVIYSRTEKQYR